MQPILRSALRLFSLALLVAPMPAQESAIGPSPRRAGSDGSARPIAAPLSEVLPQLGKQSSWEQNTRYEGPNPDKSKRGVYPVGNGFVFTYMGLGERANTMMALSGPSYAAASERLPRGHFGELTLDLEGVELPIQEVRRVTDANFVVTRDATESGLALQTLTFAAPASKVITRVIVVHNGSPAPAKNLVLSLRPTGGPQSIVGNTIQKSYAHRTGRLSATIALESGEVVAGKLSARIRSLAAGASFTAVLTITTRAENGKDGGDGQSPATPSLPAAQAAATATLRWWREKLLPTPVLRTDNHRIMDLFKDWKVLMWTMRDAHSGMVAPMVTRRGARIRESSGPLLTFLRYNMWGEARGILDYYYKAICLTGEIREHYPLDLDVSQLPEEAPDWKKISFPESDLLSWIVLQHFWYYRATWDAEFIESRKSFLIACLSKQRREDSALMRFSGDETWWKPLSSLNLADLKTNPQFIAQGREIDRRGHSLAASTLFLVALQGMGDMVNGIDRRNDPKKWAMEPSDVKDKPSQVWVERSLPVMQSLERHFWVRKTTVPVREDIDKSFKQYGDDWTGFFAPALSPVNRQPHAVPFANVNLLPLWVGFTFPTGERSQHNLRNTVGSLATRTDAKGKRASCLVGSTPKVGHFTGEVPGMLLTALVERDGKDRFQLHQELLDIAEPAGEWGQFYNPEGRPISTTDAAWPDRMSPNECGINVDASIFALNGIRHVSIPNFDNASIKLKLRLPRGTSFLEMDNLKKDNRAFNLHVDEFMAPLDEAERKANQAQKDPKYKRDPSKSHRRFRFRLELLSDNPPWGRYQVDSDVSGTMFVRYLYRGLAGGRAGTIDEKEFWRQDRNQFFLDGAPTVRTPKRWEWPGKADLLVLTNRSQAAETFGANGVHYLDTGLPFTGPELGRAILADGKPTHPLLLLDAGYDAPDARTWKRPAFWGSKQWKRTLQNYTAAGGKILRPFFVEAFQAQTDNGPWIDVAAPEGRFRFPASKTGGVRRVRARLESDRDRDVVIRIGSGCGYRATVQGTEIASSTGPRPAIRDQDAALVTLVKGTNTVLFELQGEGDPVLFLHVTDANGRPPAGVR